MNRNSVGKTVLSVFDIKAAYSVPIPISKKKNEDLQKLCLENIIPATYHTEYLMLKHANNVPDVLAETDIEDNV